MLVIWSLYACLRKNIDLLGRHVHNAQTVVRGDVYVPRFLLSGLKYRRNTAILRVMARRHTCGRNQFRSVSVSVAAVPTDREAPSHPEKSSSEKANSG